MPFPKSIRQACIALAIAVVTIAGCAAPRHQDWRQAVKAGDYAAAYADLFETWRAGTPDVKAESLRYAWRDPGIVAVARSDLAGRIQPVAAAHTGDLAALMKAVKDGPLEDRVEFAKLVDRRIDVDGEIKAAYDRRRPAPAATPAVPPAPAAAPTPRVEAPPPPAPPVTARAAPAAPPAPPPAAPAVAPTSPPATAAPKAATTPAPMAPAPPPVEKPSMQQAAPPALAAQVAEASKQSIWRCKSAAACDKAWASAEGFVAANADMRIKTASATLIETYPPIVIGEIGMKVERRSVGAGEAEIQLTVVCRAGRLAQACPTAQLRLYKAFPEHLKVSAP